MAKTGPKPKGKIVLIWSSNFAYAIGLLTADGCLSKDGRHIDFTSKDRDQVETFKECLKLDTKISIKFSGAGNPAYHTQFGDVLFYRFLESIGLTPAKSKTLSSVLIPDQYFFDFLRGYFDGDGCSYSRYDSVFRKSYRFYISFASASPKYISWLRKNLIRRIKIRGSVDHKHNSSCLQLKYSRREAILLSTEMYKNRTCPRLERKYLKIKKSMGIIEQSPGGEIGRHATFRSSSS